ncbi:L,D-transpeptidase family protein [Streptomyces sp. NPDC002588]|uniref:L,D-transpeptidase family protein n=1 Tax=Streptomyces sp. NPDC002588 TaxID=3154419 RepID=UPI0033297E7D
MRHGAVRSLTAATTAGALLLAALSACGGADLKTARRAGAAAGAEGVRATPSPVDRTRIPDVGDRLLRRIPAGSRQVLAVYGDSEDSAKSTAVLYLKRGPAWERVRSWPAHNGKKGWTWDHRLGDKRSPVGVFTLTAAGGVLDDPGTRLPYTQSEDFTAPSDWGPSHAHDFDYVIAIDYNRVKGTPPHDAEQPWGEEKGGGIWLHLDHGSGTLACVGLAREAMKHLLRTLDPELEPVVVMGDREALKA